MPDTTSMSAPSRPLVVTLPLCWNITRLMIFNNVDLPEPLTPISPIASPGSARNEMSFRTQRHGLTGAWRCMRWPIRSMRSPVRRCRTRSARKRFQTWSTTTVPSGNIGESGFHLFEKEVGDEQFDRGHNTRDHCELQIRRLTVE